MVSGKNGASGPTATPLAPVAENPELELARLPCSEATTVLATQLRQLHALLAAAQAQCRASELQSPFAKTPLVQVDFVTFLVLMIDSVKHIMSPIQIESYF